MKKKVLLVFLLMMPIICSAKEEIKYRWYTFTESDVKYVSESECDCEYLDKSDSKYTDYMYSLKEPERKEGREITSDYKDYSFLRKYVNKLGITQFTGGNQYDFYELEILDKDGNNVDYTLMNYSDNQYFLNDKKFDNTARVLTYVSLFLEFDEPIDIENTSIKVTYKNIMGEMDGINFRAYMSDEYISNYFAGYSTINTSVCDGDKCVFTSRIDTRQMSHTDVTVKTKAYKYRDTLYKCYNLTKTYAPGYYEDLPGYTKDENEFIKTNILTNEEVDSIIKENVSNSIEKSQKMINEVNNQNKGLTSEINTLKEKLNKISDVTSNLNELESILNNNSLDKDELNKKINELTKLYKSSSLNNEEVLNKLSKLSNSSNIDTTELKTLISETKTALEESNTVKNVVSKDNTENKIAMVTKEVPSKTTKTSVFFLVFGLLSLMFSFIILIKNVVKSRLK